VQAKELHPGKRNSLDALCDRYGISNSHRQLHGALLDAELLADVFLAMSRGQNSLMMDVEEIAEDVHQVIEDDSAPLPEILVLSASQEELDEHSSVLSGLDKQNKQPCLWRQ
jgi:DNA polymerase-3 subunit epsilon